MGAKTARSSKTVLSRQEIATRRKSLQQKRMQTDHTGRRALIGVVILAASTLTLFALATFDAHDRRGPGFHNAIGPVGHLVSDALLSALGICAFVVPFAGLYTAMVLFVGSKEKSRISQILSGGLLVLAGSVLAELMFQGHPGWSYPPGGALGVSLGGMLCGMFGALGTVILVSALTCVALIVGTQFAFLKLCSLAWAGMRVLGDRARESALAFWAEQKEAMARRREEAAQAKLEEQAFLAQLEADEEELAEAEREAAEAEAMAEEALRLSKEAEARELAKAQAKAAKKAPKALPEPVSIPGSIASLPPVSSPRVAIPSSPELVSQPPRPGEDPAWASSLLAARPMNTAAAPANLVSQPAAALDAAVPPAPKKGRKTPQINLPPAAPSAEAAAESTAALGEQIAAPASAPVIAEVSGPIAAPLAPVIPAPAAATPAAAAAAAGTAMVAAGATALARTPLIVEPKAPPKPTKKADQEQFVFNGDRKSFTLPPMDVLDIEKRERNALDKDAFLATAEKLRAKLADFGIVGEVVEIRPGPVVTMYEFLPGPGIKVSKIASLADDLAMAMEAMRVRIVAPIPGKGVVGIEVPNRDRETVFLKEIVEQDSFNKSQSKLTMAVGKDIEGMPYVLDLAKAPHLLIAGTTGSGKSVAVNSMIMSILLKATPEEVRFIMVDPKMLELSVYEGIPHLLLPVVTDPKKAALALRWAVEEMERRYHLLSEAGVRNITGYNKLVETAQGEAKARLAAQADSKKGKPANPAAAVVEGKVTARAESAKVAKPAKPMLIVDVADGESEDDALARAQGPQVGVPSPNAEREDVREPVELSADEEASVQSERSEEESRTETDESDAEPLAAAEADADSEAGAEAAEPEKELKKLPYIVVIIDELADLMMVASREVETYIARLAQMARAAGIHLMVATQRPSTDVVTGVIKANFPTRISFMLRSKPDSMTILGTVGAEALLGMGDMLIMPPTSAHLQRVHGAFVSENEIKKAVDHLKAQGKPVYDESILKPREEDTEGAPEEDELSDELYDQALATVSTMQNVSISMLQRKMRIGYNRAARMIERMERDGVVGPADGAKPREVLIRAVGEMPGAGAM